MSLPCDILATVFDTVMYLPSNIPYLGNPKYLPVADIDMHILLVQ